MPLPSRRSGPPSPTGSCATGYINDLILNPAADGGPRRSRRRSSPGINGPQYQEWIDAVGAVGNGVTTASWFHSPSLQVRRPVGDTQNFVKPVQPRNTVRARFHQASGSAIGVILQMAIEKAGTLDRDKVRSVLANTEFKTFLCFGEFGPDGQANSYTPPIFQIQARRWSWIYPDVIKQADLQPVAGR